jgi:hypothetical protein
MKTVTAIICLGLLAAGTAGETARAGEKVRLSGKRAPDETRESSQFFREKLEPRALRSKTDTRRPSLQGMTTSPFVPPVLPTSRILTKDELLKLQEKENWIFQSSEQGELNEENLYRALGIRGFEQPADPESALANTSATAMERYVEQQRAKELEGLAAPPDAANTPIATLANPRKPDPLSWGGDSTDPSLADSNGEGWRNHFDPTRDRFSLGAGDTLSSLQPVGLNRPDRGFIRNSLFERKNPARRSGIAHLLGSSPIESAISLTAGSVTDPINAFPDLTRQEVNPVTAARLPSATKPLFPNPAEAGKAQVAQIPHSRPGIVESLAPQPRGYLPTPPKRNSSLDPTFSPAKSVRLHLEIPRRTF